MEGFHKQKEGGARKLFAKVGIISGQDYYFWGKEMAGVLALQATSLVLTQKPQIGWFSSPGEGGPGVNSRFGVMGCSTSDRWLTRSFLYHGVFPISNLALTVYLDYPIFWIFGSVPKVAGHI